MTPEQMLFLAGSPDFQSILAKDGHLKTLEAEKNNPAAEYHLMLEMLHGLHKLKDTPVMPITPAIWSVLWTMQNAYTLDSKEISEADSDVMFYLLANGLKRTGADPVQITLDSMGFSRARGFSEDEIKAKLCSLISLAFRPLRMLPRTGSADKPVFDADWLAALVAVTARATNERATYIIHEMPLSACCMFYVQERKRTDTHGLIRKRNTGEIDAEIYRYTMELGEKFCAEHQMS